MSIDGQPESSFELFKQIADSKGMKFLNELHGRSFSLKIFRMNAVALIEAALHVSDPDHGMALMMDKNREAGQQAHRELNRHLHNFTTSAMTLVDHTRVFMKKGYADTEVYAAYEAQISGTFSDDPVSQFVQKLRNYMVHRGLPNSVMFFDLQNGSGEGASVQTGIRLETASLLQWDGWSPPARKYIKAAGDALEIRRFAEEYLTRVNRFHAVLEDALHRFHSEDCRQLELLQERRRRSLAAEDAAQHGEGNEGVELRPKAQTRSEREVRLDEMRAVTEAASVSIVNTIKEITHRKHETDFPSQHHVTVTLTDAEIIGEIVFWGPDAEGVQTLSYITREGKTFGLSERDYEAVPTLVEAVLAVPWAAKLFSPKFVEDAFLAWSRSKFLDPAAGPFANALLTAADEQITPVDVWLPIAHLEIEDAITFGPVKIAPITDAMMSDLERKAVATVRENPERIADAFQQIRKDIQGWAAVVVPMVAEPLLAEQVALLLGRDVVNLFRFFSPGAPHLSMLCPTALAGADLIPGSKVMFIKDAGLSALTSKMAGGEVVRWRLRIRELPNLNKMGLSLAGRLVAAEGLNEFEAAVRASLITYSKGTTFSDPLDRLGHALAAIEGVLLKHTMEPIEFNVADRMSFILSPSPGERQKITQNVRQAYRMRTRHRAAPLSASETEALEVFVFQVHTVLVNVLSNIPTFHSRGEFIDAVDRHGTA
ncbi:MAG: hypothetical protein K2Y04_04655 [Caulobacteraceae bacterium]|nr:hypothetical protein [Caulobacteraceae bacterium]